MPRKHSFLKKQFRKQLARLRRGCVRLQPRPRVRVPRGVSRLLYLRAPKVARTQSPRKARRTSLLKGGTLIRSKLRIQTPSEARTLCPPKVCTQSIPQACTLSPPKASAPSPPRPGIQDCIHVDTGEKGHVHVDAEEVSVEEEEPQTSFDDSYDRSSDPEEPVFTGPHAVLERCIYRARREGIDLFTTPSNEIPPHLQPSRSRDKESCQPQDELPPRLVPLELRDEESCRPEGKRRRRKSICPNSMTWPLERTYHPASPESKPGDGFWPFPKPTAEDEAELAKEQRRSEEFRAFFEGLTDYTQEDIENFQIIRWLKDDQGSQDKLERELRLARVRMRSSKVSKELEMLLVHLGDESEKCWSDDTLRSVLDRLEVDLREQIIANAAPWPQVTEGGVEGIDWASVKVRMEGRESEGP